MANSRATLCVLLFSLALPAQQIPKPASPQQLFRTVSPSVYLVEALDGKGSVVALGSGVMVANEAVVTNNHVISESAAVRIRQGNRIWPATVTHTNGEHDLARLRVTGLQSRPVSIRNSSTLEVGERVYAVGAPEGLELTFSEGLISSLRSVEGGRVIQTTAAISHGSSGGGLFDINGRLVGITSAMVIEGQNLNFALPGEWVLELEKSPVSVTSPSRERGVEDRALTWFLLGGQYYDQGRYDKAVGAYREAVRLKPDDNDAWNNLGSSYYQQKQYANAEAAYTESIRLKADDEVAWMNMGLIYDNNGEINKAEAAYQHAIRLKPDYALLWYNMGAGYLDHGLYAKAESALQRAVELKVDFVEAWYSLGELFTEQKQYARAEKAYKEAIRFRSNYAAAWNNLGNIYRLQKEYAKAESALLEAVRLKADLAQAWYNLGLLYGAQRQYAKGETAYAEAIRLKPDYAEAWYWLGLTYYVQGNRTKVMQIFETLKTLDSNLADKFFRLAVMP